VITKSRFRDDNEKEKPVHQRTTISQYQIRADYDKDTIVVYQAFSPEVADAALAAGTFVEPFSFQRMTWIKPSFLWLMERSNWGTKSGQERILAVRVRRAGWDEALATGVLTHPVPKIHGSAERWANLFDGATVHVQWDPERSLRGSALDHYSIQVGISRHLIDRYVKESVIQITDRTPEVRKIHALLRGGKADKAKALLPAERVYPAATETAKRLGMG
jgi:hypothetical protein